MASAEMIHRRAALSGLLALGGCAATGPLPSYLFSLTAWASGDKIDFLLLNASERPLRVVNLMPRGLWVQVTSATGEVLTPGAGRFADHLPVFGQDLPESYAASARRLRPWKAAKGSISTRDLLSRLHGRLTQPIDRGGVYGVAFAMEVPVIDAGDEVRLAAVQARSVCTITYERRAFRIDCRGPW